MTDAALHKLQRTGCDVRTDRLTRILFATDASIYQIEPQAVAFPRSAEEASAVIGAGIDAGLSITPRGAGTSLVGNAIGDGLIVDFSRHNRGISELDLEKRMVRVGAGVVLDQLNAFLKPHRFCFGPDVATSSRALSWPMDESKKSAQSTTHSKRNAPKLNNYYANKARKWRNDGRRV